MKSSAILSVILIFVSIDCNSIDYKPMCYILKPNGIFKGIKAYKSMENTLQMYGKGKEWQFVATNEMIYLLPETLTMIMPRKIQDLGQWKQNYSDLVTLRIDYYYGGFQQCFV